MSAIAHGMWLLLRHPDQLAKLAADRSLMKSFVEEVLRYDAPVHGILRFTSADVEVAGTPIPKSTVVMLRYAAANRDEAKFPNPDAFDITRTNASQHLSFGYGPHFCVGAALARQEMISAFTALFDRLDDIRLAAPAPVPAHEPSFFLRPMKELQITFRKAGQQASVYFDADRADGRAPPNASGGRSGCSGAGADERSRLVWHVDVVAGFGVVFDQGDGGLGCPFRREWLDAGEHRLEPRRGPAGAGRAEDGVATTPGQMQLTRMLNISRNGAQVWVNICTPAFEAA